MIPARAEGGAAPDDIEAPDPDVGETRMVLVLPDECTVEGRCRHPACAVCRIDMARGAP